MRALSLFSGFLCLFWDKVWKDPDSNTPPIPSFHLEDGIQAPFPRMSSLMALPTPEIDYNEYAKSILELWTNQFFLNGKQFIGKIWELSQINNNKILWRIRLVRRKETKELGHTRMLPLLLVQETYTGLSVD